MPEFQIPDIPKTYMSWRSTVLGVEAESVESQLSQYFGVKEGVLVPSGIKGSAAEKAGLKAGDVITKVDSTPVASPREISNIIRIAHAKRTVSLSVLRERREMTMSLPLEDPDPDRAGSGSVSPRTAVSVSFSGHCANLPRPSE